MRRFRHFTLPTPLALIIKMKTQKQTYWRIPKPTKEVKNFIKYSLLGIAIALMIIVFFRLIIPIMLNIVSKLLFLVDIYINNLDNINIKFFGGLAFLFIGWKILESILLIWIKVIGILTREFRK